MPEISGGNILLNTNAIFAHVQLTAGMRVADLGCGGAGHFAIPAARAVGKDGTVYAVDIVKSALESIRSKAKMENLGNIETVWSNLEIVGATKIDPDSLDVGMLINVLFQITKLENVIKESMRLVKPGGKILVVDWKTSGAPFGPKADTRVGVEKIKGITKQLNLSEVEEFEAGPYHWGLILKK